ncbi:MAG: alpha/beta hydrolase, partial [Clostridia bacterium]|nr:alpha/beta hydrolase [Clostridia bacterium]
MHGWGGSVDSFRGAFDVFSKKYRCTVLDFYGFGESNLPSVLTLDDYAKGVEEIIDKYEMKNVILVGHSFGGRVAILLASRLSKIKSIVLVDSAGLKPRYSIKKSIRKLTYKSKKLLKMDTSNCGSADYRALSGDMRETFKNVVNFYLDGYLERIKCDALIIWGKRDKDTPPYMARRLHRGIYN